MTQEAVAAAQPVVMGAGFWIATIIFLLVYAVIVSEKIHKTIIALFGAGLLLLLSKTDEPHHILAEVEWPTIFFFIGLFIIIGGVVKVGLIKWLSIKVLELTQGNLFATSMVVMWFSAFASAFIDNIPYVATMNPLIIDMAKQLWPNVSGIQLLHHPDLMPLWWSLALGACLGGNGTAIGASANVIVVGMSEKAGKKYRS